MPKFVEVKIKEKKGISDVIGDSLNMDSDNLKKAIDIFEYNTKPIILNWTKYNSYILMGDVQSGKTNNLIYLSYELFKTKKVNAIFYLTGTKNDLLNQNQERFFKAFGELGDKFQIYRNRNIDSGIFEANSHKNIIINSLKTLYRLKQMKELIESNSPNINYLIIDDEADEGSTSKDTFKILKLLSLKENVKYVAITATPFKNLYRNQDFYDYFHIFKPGIGYQGLDYFNDTLKIENNKDRIIAKAFIEWIIKTVNKKINDSQILFNIMNLNKGHNIVFKTLNKLLNLIKQRSNLVETIKNNYPESLDNVEAIHDFVNKLSLEDFIINNGEAREEPENKGYEVIIGGLKLSRGITYKYLKSEVMLNMGKKDIDPGTLIQRARWLGYGKNLEDIDIYVNATVQEALIEAVDLINMTKDFSMEDGSYKKIFNSMKYERLKLK